MTSGAENGGVLAKALAAIARAREEIERQVRDAVSEVDERVAELRGRVDKLAAKADQEGPLPFHWADLEPEERAEKWGQLQAWVAEVLEQRHPRHAQALRSCWDDHPAAVDAVSAAWFAWSGAYRGASRRPVDPAAWMRDWLPALEKQLTDELGEGHMPCRMGHEQRRPR